MNNINPYFTEINYPIDRDKILDIAKRNRRRVAPYKNKKEHLEKLEVLIERNLDGFQRGDFERQSVRQTVAKVIVNQFKNYLKIY